MTNEPHSAWHQINLWHETWQAAEHTATTHLRPLLTNAEAEGAPAAWWFIRKRGSWRLRLLPAPGHAAALARLATTLTDDPAIRDRPTSSTSRKPAASPARRPP